MLNAASLAFIAGGARWGQVDGEVMFLFILTLAAAEVSVALGTVLSCRTGSIHWTPMHSVR